MILPFLHSPPASLGTAVGSAATLILAQQNVPTHSVNCRRHFQTCSSSDSSRQQHVTVLLWLTRTGEG